MEKCVEDEGCPKSVRPWRLVVDEGCPKSVFVAPRWCLGRYVRMRGCPKNGIWSAPMVLGSRKVCKEEGVSKDRYFERPRGDW